MKLIPAIDIIDGQCVRLKQGRMEDDTIFSNEPVKMAERWINIGARRLHIVDLNGAFAGKPVNASVIQQIITAYPNIPIQVGGGIRDMATIEAWLSHGLARIILGTIAVEDPTLVREAALAFPGKIAVGLDAREGRVAIRGWTSETNIMVTDLAQQFEDDGITAIIYTDINRDGAMGGPNVAATEALARAVNIPVIASGGVSSMQDLHDLKATGVISGAISGRALYDGAINLANALDALK